MISKHQYKILAILIASFITALVFIGRDLQNLLKTVFETYPFVLSTFISFISISFIFIIYILVRFIIRKNYRFRTIALSLLVLILGYLIIHIGKVWVEYLHVFLYSALYISVFRGFDFRKMPYILTFIVTNFISIFDEFLQHLHPARVGDWRDIQLNFVSTCLGFFLAIVIFNTKDKKEFLTKK
jgi:hypothetical protein